MNRNRDPNMRTKLSAGRFDDGILYKGKTKDVFFCNDTTTCDVIKVVIKMEDVKRSKTTAADGRVGVYAGQPGVAHVKVSGGRKVKHKEVRDAGKSRDGTLLISKGNQSSYQIEVGYKYTVTVYSKSRDDKSHQWSKKHQTQDINDTWKEFRFLDKHAKVYERINSGGGGGSDRRQNKNEKKSSSKASPTSSSYKVGSTYKGDPKKLEPVRAKTSMDKGDKAFVKRSDGSWTYAKVVKKSSDYLEFEIDGRGDTKKYYRKDFDRKVARRSI